MNTLNFKISGLLILVLAATGCASKSADIAPTFISPTLYQGQTCEQLGQEAQSISQRAAVVNGQQDKAHDGDVAKTTVGVIIFLPVLLFNEGNGAKAAEVANLKGQMQAVQQQSIQKNCGFTFQG